MSGEKLILLLDIDGVLLESVGYRSACVDTINDFIARMGQPGLTVDRQTADTFEVNGIKAEWDMVPLALAAFADACIGQTGIIPDGDVFPPDFSAASFADTEAFRAMMQEKIRAYAGMPDPNLNVIDAVRIGCEKGKVLPFLRKTPLCDRFFTGTLDPWKSPFFAQLMCRLLGSETFAEFYGMAAPLECDSYLAVKDRLLVSDHYRKLLPELYPRAYPVVMTYRPTRLPACDGNMRELYYVNTPEGECALRLLGWDNGRMPMIGSGSLCYTEAKYGLRRESYVKPHPFHILASVMMALCRNEMQALEAARILCEGDPRQEDDPLMPYAATDVTIRLAVFEDSVSGIEGTKNAVSVLRRWGRNAEAVLCGIRSTGEKTALLSRTGALIYQNVNEAFDEVIGKI